MLLSTLEEEKIRSAIPECIVEDIQAEYHDEAVEPIQTELDTATSDNEKLLDERDKLVDACIKFVIERYLLNIGKIKARKFTLTAYQISCDCEALSDSYINIENGFHSYNDATYLVKSDKDKFTFILND